MAVETPTRPEARSDIHVQDIGDEVMLYDSAGEKIHVLLRCVTEHGPVSVALLLIFLVDLIVFLKEFGRLGDDFDTCKVCLPVATLTAVGFKIHHR